MGLFPSLPVTSHQGSTLNFEKLQRLLNSEWNSLSALGYKNSWEDFEVGKRLGEYRIDLLGNVMLRGVIKGGESAKAAVVLPPDFHPGGVPTFAVSASVADATVVINGAGEVTPVNAAASEVKTYCFLDGVYFSTRAVA